MFASFINRHQLAHDFITVAKTHFVPLAETIIEQQSQQLKSPFFVAINGCQGSGKSTLSDFICDYISHYTDLNIIVLSLDDFYFSQKIRSELANTIHPLLATRGVPGTHDTQHIQQIFTQLAEDRGTVALPRFNKVTDNPFPIEQWPKVNLPVDIVLFEGWCWGVTPQDEQALIKPVNDLEQEFDTQGLWRSFVNQTLSTDYLPLYDEMDFWVLLQAPSFTCVYQWRLEQEHKLTLKTDIKDRDSLMSDQQVLQFIQYYQRLTEHCLATMGEGCDLVYYLNKDRQIERTVTKKKD
ncbi:kinase [Psychromonas antarctica]|jgi:D-glycerate 3-kinase|uniref:kinase n=1 Tax=Psychromonas antarctica TaxID=67573 RepID=UPI001EE94682|nr:kinase [Psychromonas antarctica]MCG6199647.1 kinase [Psychromonas antarctica]